MLLVVCFCFQSKASNLDSLSKYIHSAPEDTAKVEALIKLGKELRNGQVDSATIIYEQALQLSKKIKWGKGKASSYIGLASCKNIQSNYPSAVEYFYSALSIYEKIQDKNGIAIAYGGLGVLFKNQQELEKALEYHNKALAIDIEIENKRRIPIHYGNIGVVYKHLQDFDKALEYYYKALKMDEELDNIDGQSRHLGNIGVIYKNQKKYDKAIKYYFKSLEISKQQNDLDGILTKSLNISRLYTIIGNYKEAETYLQRSLEIANQLGSLKGLFSAYEASTSLYEEMGKPALALKSYRTAMAYKDSIFNEDNRKEILRQEINFEYEKKQAVEQAEYEKQLAIAEAEKKKQQLFLIFMGVLLLAVGIITFIVFRSLRVSNKQNQLIEQQKIEVELQKNIVDNKNREITDSIIYARRIQQAILPSTEALKTHLKDGFIFYKPKDVVSGDFYWMEQHNNQTFFAVADCTGHGVPGAMVSVVCSNALTKALIEENNVKTPGKLLDRARELVVQRFEKSEEDVKDGMDISLCSLQLSESSKLSESYTTLHWAGANNPLWIIRKAPPVLPSADGERRPHTSHPQKKGFVDGNSSPSGRLGGAELIETKPNKQPIGKVDNPEPFITHTIELQKGDTFYIFTDGFADQFGGKKGKKMMYKPFKDLLLSIQDKTMDEQKVILEQHFDTWKGKLEQVDDVCIIGVRI
jgi:tetratricopeptide (TPR) repeat protein